MLDEIKKQQIKDEMCRFAAERPEVVTAQRGILIGTIGREVWQKLGFALCYSFCATFVLIIGIYQPLSPKLQTGFLLTSLFWAISALWNFGRFTTGLKQSERWIEPVDGKRSGKVSPMIQPSNPSVG